MTCLLFFYWLQLVVEMNGQLSDPLLKRGISRCLSRLSAVKVMCDSYFPRVFQEDYQVLLNTTEIGSPFRKMSE
jgi:hypothetical protein